MQRDPAVRGVEGLAAAAGLGVERPAGGDEGGDVGDGVEHLVAPVGAFDEQGLVQVGGRCRIDGHELDMRQVQVRQLVLGHRRLRVAQHVLGERARQFQRGAQRLERPGKLVLLLVDAGGQAMMGHENQVSPISAISLG